MANLLLKRSDAGTDITTPGSTWTLVDPDWGGGPDAQAIGDAYKEGEYLLVTAFEEYSVIIASVVITTTYDFYLTSVELPAVTGTLHTGDTLTSTHGDWTGDTDGSGPITYAYEWHSNTALDLTGTDVAIPAATASTYVIQAADAGLFLYCIVTATDDDTSLSENSNVVGPAINP